MGYTVQGMDYVELHEEEGVWSLNTTRKKQPRRTHMRETNMHIEATREKKIGR